jgi:hypothetical protein
VYLVFCSDTDAPAIWAYQRLRAVGLTPVELITSSSLALAKTWEHRLGPQGIDLKVELVDGRVFYSSNVRGVLNRLVSAPQDVINRAVTEDREYASAELAAFYISWMSALPGVINRPMPEGLSGSWRHRSEWTLLAAHAGLNTLPYRQPSMSSLENGYASLAPSGEAVTSIIVLQGELFGAKVHFDVGEACRKLAENARTDLLGVDLFNAGNDTLMFAHATPLPDLTVGGNEFIDALARALRVDRC